VDRGLFGLMMQPLAQHRYFADVLPGLGEWKNEVKVLLGKQFAGEQ
jgi:hypothetical protein